ncbi:MAG: NAD(P)-binding domain-containing protein [Succinatimonas sp.]|nr:NAD(P)-binding domain-containing protein [Succinatimonas sp.]
MKYGILGTGDVAYSIGSKLIALGHEVMLSSRNDSNEKAENCTKANGERAFCGTFSDASRFGERIFLCVRGIYSTEVVKTVGEENLAGKILIDLTNSFIYKDGHISLDPRWSIATCLGEEIQKLLPQTKVVKTLNYLCSSLMTTPQQLPENATGFYCGNDTEAKTAVAKLLKDFGWQDTMDLGDISMSRYTEMLGAFWPAAYSQLKHMNWGFKLIR